MQRVEHFGRVFAQRRCQPVQATGRGAELGHDAWHVQRQATGGDDALDHAARPVVRVLGDVLHGVDAAHRHARRLQGGHDSIDGPRYIVQAMNRPSSSIPPTGPLAGMKVIELGQLIAGPFAGKTLGDFGADVIKIEPPGDGDPLRKWRMLHEGTSVWWQVQSRNKRSVVLDLRTDEGRADVRKLAAEADVLIENFKPGTMEKWGLGYEVLAADNPGLVMLRISGYGQTGPYRDLPGFAVVAEAMGGMRHLMGEPGRVDGVGDLAPARHLLG